MNILTANLIRGRVVGEGVKDILLDENQSLKVVQCDEDGEVLGGGTPLKVMVVDTDGDSLTLDDNDNLKVTLATALSSDTDSITSVEQPAASLGHGIKNVTTAGTDVALATSTACKYVIVQARYENTSTIAVGGPGVDATATTGTGIILEPGDSVTLDVDNLADVYIDSLVNGEGVRFTYGVA